MKRFGSAAIAMVIAASISLSAEADSRVDAIKTFIALKQGVLSGASYDEFRKAAIDTKAACEFATITATPGLKKSEKEACDTLVSLTDAGLEMFRHRFDDCPTPGQCTDYYPRYRNVDISSASEEDKLLVQKQLRFLDLAQRTMPEFFKPVAQGGFMDVDHGDLFSGETVLHHGAVVAALYGKIAAQCDLAVSAFRR
jgi:hypothetical protein